MVRRPALPPRRRTHRWRPAAWSRSARGTTDHRGSAGVLKGAPLSAVHAETADLLIPATAEIAAVRRPQRDRDRSCGASRPPVRDGLSVVRRPVASRWPCRRPAPAPRHRWRWALAALLFAGFVAVIASVGRSTLSGTGSALRHLDWAWIPPALVAEFTSMTAFARAQRRLLRGGGIDLRFVSVVAVTYAGNAISVSLPVAGPEVGTAFAFHQFRRRGADLATASWALVVSGLISSFAFALVVAGGAIASGSGSAAAMGLAMATLALTPIVAFLLALRYQAARRFINHMTTPVVKSLNRLRKRPETGPVPAFDSFLDRLASIKLPGLHYAEVVLLLMWNWVGDCLCLACTIRATGSVVPWHSLFLAYGATAAGIISLTPGGLGVVEIALSAALVAAGLGGPHAFAAVLVYRLISFWLVMAAGWVVMAMLSRSSNVSAPKSGTASVSIPRTISFSRPDH